MTVLTTQRLTLTPMQADDFDFLFAMWRHPVFCKAMNVEPMSEETVWMRLLRDIGHWQVCGYGNWLVRLKDSNTPIGSMGIFNYRRDMVPVLTVPELGWGFHPDFHRKGYGLESLSAALTYTDQVMKAPLTAAIISHANTASQGLARQAGYVDAGEVSFHGKPALFFERARPDAKT
jgi:RimJ/RimL family protein N-acetyltransferase